MIQLWVTMSEDRGVFDGRHRDVFVQGEEIAAVDDLGGGLVRVVLRSGARYTARLSADLIDWMASDVDRNPVVVAIQRAALEAEWLSRAGDEENARHALRRIAAINPVKGEQRQSEIAQMALTAVNGDLATTAEALRETANDGGFDSRYIAMSTLERLGLAEDVTQQEGKAA